MIIVNSNKLHILPIEPPKENKDILSNNIIETKPPVKLQKVEIKPSKILVTNEKKSSEKKISTVVQVMSQPISSSKVEVKSAPITKVNVVEGKSSVAVPHPPLAISKVQVGEPFVLKFISTIMYYTYMV